MFTVTAVLVVVAFGCSVASLAGKLNVAVPVFLIALVELIRILPL